MLGDLWDRKALTTPDNLSSRSYKVIARWLSPIAAVMLSGCAVFKPWKEARESADRIRLIERELEETEQKLDDPDAAYRSDRSLFEMEKELEESHQRFLQMLDRQKSSNNELNGATSGAALGMMAGSIASRAHYSPYERDYMSVMMEPESSASKARYRRALEKYRDELKRRIEAEEEKRRLAGGRTKNAKQKKPEVPQKAPTADPQKLGSSHD